MRLKLVSCCSVRVTGVRETGDKIKTVNVMGTDDKCEEMDGIGVNYGGRRVKESCRFPSTYSVCRLIRFGI